MAEEKKLTTAEILALARKQANTGSTPKSDNAPESVAEEASAAEVPASEAPEPKKPAAKPTSTADILAAARAQKASGGSAPKPAAATEAKSAAAPKSTSDILAAARSQGGGTTPGKPAADKPASKKVAAKVAAPVGDRPALKEMVAAVREAKSSGAPVAPKLPVGSKPVAPKLPVKQQVVSRRGFWAAMLGATAAAMTPFVIAWGAFAAVMGLWSLGMARFMMPNMVLELPSQFKVGPKSDFPPGTVSEKFKASRGIWIVNTDQYDGRGMIYALASVCTHLGCTPNWLEGEQKFKCPCHGSGFYITGINFEGPAPRPLERVGIRVAPDGLLEVDKSVKFQEELGQWADPKSFELA